MGDNNATIGIRSIPYGGCYYVDEGLSVADSSVIAAPNPTGRLLRTNIDTLQSISFASSDAHLHKITTDGTIIEDHPHIPFEECKPKRHKHYKPKFTL